MRIAMLIEEAGPSQGWRRLQPLCGGDGATGLGCADCVEVPRVEEAPIGAVRVAPASNRAVPRHGELASAAARSCVRLIGLPHWQPLRTACRQRTAS